MAATRRLRGVTILYDQNNDPVHVQIISEVSLIDPDNNARIVRADERNVVLIGDLTGPQVATIDGLAGGTFVPILNSANPL